MATATYTPTTSGDTLKKLWRKVQGKLQTGLNFVSEEYGFARKLKNFEIDWSAREITVPIDLNEGAGVASIAEAGYEARPSSPTVEEITLTWTLFNKRFTASKTAMWIDRHNPEAELKKQLVFQGMKAVQDLGRHVSDYFYGFTTAVLCETTTAATQSSGAYTLDNLYGVSSLGSARQIADKFRVGDYVALLDSGSLVTNAIGKVTAVSSSTPSITVTWNGSVTSTSGMSVVKANSVENATIAGTDSDQGLAGLWDVLTSTSLHSLSSSTAANWSVAYSDTSGGRFSGVRLHHGKDEVANWGGGTINRLIMAQDVYRDMIALQQAALRFNDPFAMELDGDIKSKGIRILKTRRTPDGVAIGYDDSAFHRMTLLPEPDGQRPAWEDGYKLQDLSGFVFSLDWPMQLVTTNRKKFAYWTGLDGN